MRFTYSLSLPQRRDILPYSMVALCLRGGQITRTTQLFIIGCCNGLSTSRGIYVHAGSAVYVIRHSKYRHSTNPEFQVAQYLGRQDSEILATDLIYVRSFFHMLSRSFYGTNQEHRFLSASHDSPKKAWKADLPIEAFKG
jgi:hypothetical protein